MIRMDDEKCVVILGRFSDEEEVGEVKVNVEERENCSEGKEEEEVKDEKDLEVKGTESVSQMCVHIVYERMWM